MSRAGAKAEAERLPRPGPRYSRTRLARGVEYTRASADRSQLLYVARARSGTAFDDVTTQTKEGGGHIRRDSALSATNLTTKRVEARHMDRSPSKFPESVSVKLPPDLIVDVLALSRPDRISTPQQVGEHEPGVARAE